ncbi:putative acyl-activating enzyme 19 [Phtheirospermum japonicum]|uniref:Putative acyl-activating enzyme 19 n=1 Tax=Phtheirospermum japonicum TaxID=374723 RepID=A0A830DDC6_9LAMI|nr:putative acyl-activating enzyme 19 [Phtheirospermum japonicum]
MAAGETAERQLSACCISHEFYKAASKSPNKIAAIHASGFARNAGGSLDAYRPPRGDCDKSPSVDTASSSRPPVYDGDECFTFSDILSAVENLSSRLWQTLHGADDSCLIKTGSEHVRNPKVIGIYMEPSVEYIISVLSILRFGEAFMPLDPTWPKARILSLISSSKADLVVGIESSTEGNCFHSLDKLKWLIDEGACPVLHISVKEIIKKQSHPLRLGWPCESESLRSFCYLMYTSGSSGKPKGVCGTEIGLLNRFSWMQEMYPLHGGDVVLFKTAGYFINRLVAVPSLMRALIPSLQSPRSITIQGSLKLLVLSGETLHLPLCKKLLKLLPQTSILNFVPIGLPLSNCDVILVGDDTPYQGEIYVGGPCVAAGYFDYPHLTPLADGRVSPESGCIFKNYFKTGDFARKLPTGDLLFLGRKDRTVKVNGHRIALEEIEGALRDHPDVVDAAVLSREVDGEILLLEAHVVRDEAKEDDGLFKSCLRDWVLSQLPHMMIPSCILLTGSLPLTSSGKVDYSSLASLRCADEQARINIEDIHRDRLIEVIKKVFSDALMVENVSVDDDFFEMGGNSITAAYVTFKLGINMKLLYTYPTPLRLQTALSSSTSSLRTNAFLGMPLSTESKLTHTAKKLKAESREQNSADIVWNPSAVHKECSFSRCNKSKHGGQCERSYSCDAVRSNIIQRDGKGFMRTLWKVDLGSCIDASPLVWETKLEGRVECSATILDDFSQSDVTTETFISLTFQTAVFAGVFKLMVRCGSYDHNLYAIDYKSYCCIYKLPCGGSIFGSPALNEMREMLCVATTSGHVTALEIKSLPFKTLWKQDMGAPVFGSLSINYSDGNIICCLVDGTVVVLSACGSIIWKVRTGGPIFAGPSLSHDLPSQVRYSYAPEMEASILLKWLICVCSSSGSIHLLRVHSNAIEGVNRNNMVHEFARLDLKGDIFSSPVMIGGRVFVGCRDDHVYCIQLDVE